MTVVFPSANVLSKSVFLCVSHEQADAKSLLALQDNLPCRKWPFEKIKWQYIECLNDLQEEIRLSLQSIEKKHLLWEKHKMNVKISAQTPSASVVGAVNFTLGYFANWPDTYLIWSRQIAVTSKIVEEKLLFGPLYSAKDSCIRVPQVQLPPLRIMPLLFNKIRYHGV